MGVRVRAEVAFRAFNSYRNRFVLSSTMLNVTNVFCIHVALCATNALPYVLP